MESMFELSNGFSIVGLGFELIIRTGIWEILMKIKIDFYKRFFFSYSSSFLELRIFSSSFIASLFLDKS